MTYAMPACALTLPRLHGLGEVHVRRLGLLLLIVLCYQLAAVLSYPFTDLSVMIASIWLPSGIAMLMVLHGGYRMLPLMVVCNMTADISFGGFDPLAAAGIALVSAAECALGAAVLRRGLAAGLRFEMPSIMKFVIGGLILAPVVSASGGTAWLMVMGGFETGEGLELWRNWAISVMMSILLVVPLFESWRLYGRPRFRGNLAEAGAVLLVLAMLSTAVFAYELSRQNIMLPLLYSMLFLVVWCAIYFRESGTTTAFAVAILIGCVVNATVSVEPIPSWVIGVYAVPFALVGMILAASQRRLEQTVATEVRQQELERLAYQDPLTGLANRAEFEHRLEQVLSVAKGEGARVALVFIDLDGFKPINDTFGHQVGDRLLQVIGERLRDTVRQTDLVARLGGDEFVVLITKPGGPDEIQRASERLAGVFAQPIQVDGRSLRIQASQGIGLYPDDALTPSELVRHADYAMYAAKQTTSRVSSSFH